MEQLNLYNLFKRFRNVLLTQYNCYDALSIQSNDILIIYSCKYM